MLHVIIFIINVHNFRKAEVFFLEFCIKSNISIYYKLILKQFLNLFAKFFS